MTIFTSQSVSASLQTDDNTETPIVPERDPWKIRASVRAFGPCSGIDRPLPPITDGLAARILRVSHFIEHAAQNTHLKGAAPLLRAESIYSTALRDCLTSLKSKNTALYWNINEELQHKPDSIDSMKNRLSREFELFATGQSGPRFFHFRNNTAYLYQQANKLKDGPLL